VDIVAANTSKTLYRLQHSGPNDLSPVASETPATSSSLDELARLNWRGCETRTFDAMTNAPTMPPGRNLCCQNSTSCRSGAAAPSVRDYGSKLKPPVLDGASPAFGSVGE
jgi:hypothetical protein